MPRTSFALLRPSFPVIAILAIVQCGLAADLDRTQSQNLSFAKSEVQRFETNLKLAQDTAGPGDAQPTGSKAKLAAMRLETALQSKAKAEAYLARLPADNADVKAVQGSLDKVTAQADALQERLAGKKAGSDKMEDRPAGDTVKLNYQQSDALKNARFYLTEIEGYAGGLEEFARKVSAAQDKAAISASEFQSARQTVDKARQRNKNAQDHLKGLPENGEGVKDVSAGLSAAMARIEKTEAELKPASDAVMKLVDPASHADYQKDLDRIRDLTRGYSNTQPFQGREDEVMPLIDALPASRNESQALADKYADLMKQDTPESESFRRAVAYFGEKVGEFEKLVEREKQELPGKINSDLDRLNKMVEDATTNRKPAFFKGGIPQVENEVETRISLLAAMDASAAKEYQVKLDAAKQSIKQSEALLIKDIIASNEVPQDRYNGADKEDLKNLAIETWKKSEPNAEVLGVYFPAQEWKRETSWRYSAGVWSKSDRSKLQAQLIVKRDNDIAVNRPVNLIKDHMQNDAVSGYPFDGKDEPVAPEQMIPMSKVK